VPERRRGLVGPFSGRQILLAFGSVVAAAVILVVVTTPLGTTGTPGPRDPRPTGVVVGPVEEGLRPGDRAPELVVTSSDGVESPLLDLDGQPMRLADFRGKAVWLNFWASWCPPCQAETPTIRDLAKEYSGRGLVVVAVNVQETADIARRYAERYELEHVIGADVRADVFHRFKAYVLPTQFFIGPDGIIRERILGQVDRASAVPLIESILPT
jgi:thiol-disulfide isomerase/thioredoxin